MNRRPLLLLALLSSCGPSAVEPVLPDTMEPLVTSDAGTVEVTDAGVEPAGDGGTLLTGLPCDVKAVLQTHCMGCHNGHTYVRPLATRQAFLDEHSESKQPVGRLVVQRMQPNAAEPMPPVGYMTTPSAADAAVISAWVSAGMPGGACGTATK